MGTGTLLDGGYYAIKGFNFQYDLTLLEILKQTNTYEQIEIEQTEDFSNKNTIVQVKYKEKTAYSNSSIKKPVCQLLEIFDRDKREPILYCYFNNVIEGEKKLTLEELNSIIGDCKIKNKQYTFSEDLKRKFVSHFTLVFTHKFQEQFEILIDKVKQEFNCEEDEALIYYSQMYKHIERKVIDFSPDNKINRVCCKSELIELVKTGREIIFNSNYTEIMGKERYYKYIYKKYFRENNRNFHERFFLIHLQDSYTIEQLKNIVNKLKETFYFRRTVRGHTTITSPAPYVLFHGVKLDDLKALKVTLQSEGVIFRDGFGFEDAEFYPYNIIEECTSQNNIELKFINRIEFVPTIIEKISRTKKVYWFNNGQALGWPGLETENIQIDAIADIYDYLF